MDFWNNFSLEDLSQFWDLPNKFETDLCYIQELEMSELGCKNEDIFPQKNSISNFVYENLGEEYFPRFQHWRSIKNLFGSLTAVSLVMFSMI